MNDSYNTDLCASQLLRKEKTGIGAREQRLPDEVKKKKKFRQIKKEGMKTLKPKTVTIGKYLFLKGNMSIFKLSDKNWDL